MDTARPDPLQPAQTTFGALLRHYRLAAGLTQEELALRAGLSVQGLSALENGRRQAPYRHTVAQLAAALGLDPGQTTALAATLVRFRAPAGAAVPQGANAATGPTLLRFLPAPPELRGNLPMPLTSFIGREREQGEVRALLDAARLVTLTGAGGCGKTRLALMVAGTLTAAYPDGVWLADLAALADPSLVLRTVAQVLGLHEHRNRTPLEALIDHLKHRRVLLVVDNCEHLIGACAELVTALLRHCPQLRLLATSREALEVAGEVVYRVRALTMPDLDRLPSADRLAQYEAIQLFVERAQARRTDFTLSSTNVRAVAQVCTRLDGMPLAIELAAARAGSLPVEAIATRLDDRFRLLTGGPRTVLPRQQTLRATVTWSYSLLSVPEQTLFNRLAVFAGGFSLEAAEAVCAGGTIATEAVLNLLPRLVDKSLVVAEGSAGGVERYRLLETLRQYGQECLPAGGETRDLYTRHLAYYGALAEEAEFTMWGPQHVAWIARLNAEQMNIRQALRWALDVGAAQGGMRLAGVLQAYWHMRGAMLEGEEWLVALLALPEAATRTTARARALTTLAAMHRSSRLLDGAQTVGAETEALVAEAISIARETGNKWALAQALGFLGRWIAREDYAAGRAMVEESIALCRELDFHASVAGRIHILGDLAWEQGDTIEAHTWWSEALRLGRQVGDQENVAATLGDLGMMAFHEGDYATAQLQIAESLALYRSVHSHNLAAGALGCLGAVARAQGDTTLARACYEEKLAFWREVGNQTGIAATLAEMGALALQEGDHAQEDRLFQEAITLQRALEDTAGEAASLAHLGSLAAARGEHGRAVTRYREGQALARATGDRVVTALCLEGLAALAIAGGRLDRAARLYGAAACCRTGTFVLNVWDDRVARDRQIEAVRAALGEEVFAAAWAEGRSLSLEAAIALALEGHDAGR